MKGRILGAIAAALVISTSALLYMSATAPPVSAAGTLAEIHESAGNRTGNSSGYRVTRFRETDIASTNHDTNLIPTAGGVAGFVPLYDSSVLYIDISLATSRAVKLTVAKAGNTTKSMLLNEGVALVAGAHKTLGPIPTVKGAIYNLQLVAGASAIDYLVITEASGAVARAGGGGSPFSSASLDTIGSTRGSILYRGASGWAILTPGTSGHVLKSGGAGADPSYQAESGGGGGGGTLDQAYDSGGAGAGRTITVDSGAVALTNNGANGNGVLEITKDPAAEQDGDALYISMGDHAGGCALRIETSHANDNLITASGPDDKFEVLPSGRIRLANNEGEGAQIICGSGSPEGLVTAPVGSIFLRKSDGGAGSTFYVKESGAGNTGWVAK